MLPDYPCEIIGLDRETQASTGRSVRRITPPWEYKTLRQSFGKDYLSTREDASFDRQLSDPGAQGWELILVQPVATYNPSLASP